MLRLEGRGLDPRTLPKNFKVSHYRAAGGNSVWNWRVRRCGSAAAPLFRQTRSLSSSKVGNYRGESVEEGLRDRIVRDAPPLTAGIQVFEDLLDSSDQHIWALKKFVGSQLRPSAGQFLSSLAAVVRHDYPLHEGIDFEPSVSFVAGGFLHELHRSSTPDTRQPDRSGGAAPPSLKVIPERPTMSASRAARDRSCRPLPPIRIGGWGF